MSDLLDTLTREEGSPDGAALQPRAEAVKTIPSDIVSMIDAAREARDVKEAEAEASRFKWHDPEEDSIVVRGQRSIAVYRNPVNAIVIREESPEGDDEDAFIVLRDPETARLLIAALTREVGGK